MTRYRAVCDDCPWSSSTVDTAAAAQTLADAHTCPITQGTLVKAASKILADAIALKLAFELGQDARPHAARIRRRLDQLVPLEVVGHDAMEQLLPTDRGRQVEDHPLPTLQAVS